MGQSDADAKAGRLNRKRARQACTECRDRKIRCDVTKHGQPCTNCRDSDATCSIKARKNARASSRAVNDAGPSHSDSSSQRHYLHSVLNHEDEHDRRNNHGNGNNHHQTDGLSTVNNHQSSRSDAFGVPVADFDAPGMNADGSSTQFSNDSLYAGLESFIDADLMDLVGIENVFNASETYPDYNNLSGTNPFNNGTFRSPEVQSARFPVTYASTPDVQNNTADSPYSTTNPPDDAVADRQVLHSQGCLNIPHPTIVEHLARLYFEYVHPNLPIIDEAEFWKWLPRSVETGGHSQGFSLTVLQAMFFTAISFASEDIVRQSGFSNPKKARMIFYRRAKLLIDFEFEPDPLVLSQACLLLSYHSPATNGLRINSRWIGNAIHFARIIGAPNFSRLNGPNETRRRSMLKRLWWGCILRDRIMPLGVRRPIQIPERVTREENDQHFLNEGDFTAELGQSRIHTIEEQRRIFYLITTACRLADALTPVMECLFSTKAPGITIEQSACSFEDVLRYKADLYKWHSHASRQFPAPIGLGDEPNSVILLANMMFVYYNTAVISLCHKYLTMKEAYGLPATTHHTQEDPVKECATAIDDITDRTKELVQLNIAKYAPISLSAYLTFPLLLHALNARAARLDDFIAAQERRRLDIYTRVMQIQRAIYEGCEYPCDLIDKLLAYANEHNPTPPPEDTNSSHNNTEHASSSRHTPDPRYRKPSTMMKWIDLLEKRPRLYLRLASHIDLAFCTGLPPKEEDFAVPLRRHQSSSWQRAQHPEA